MSSDSCIYHLKNYSRWKYIKMLAFVWRKEKPDLIFGFGLANFSGHMRAELKEE